MHYQKMTVAVAVSIFLLAPFDVSASFVEESDYSFVSQGGSSDDYSSRRAERYDAEQNENASTLLANEFREPTTRSRQVNHYTSREYYEETEFERPRAVRQNRRSVDEDSYPKMPIRLAKAGEKVIVVNPNIHRWGAYAADGTLLRSGKATAGSSWCDDIQRPCKTSAGTFRIKSLGSEDCKSTRFPVGEGGAPMPYCMFFNGGQGLHGSNEVVSDNVSHGCVRLRVSDAYWIRYNFAAPGTKVVILPY